MASTTPLDWIEDVCGYTNFMAASYENKIYTVGGEISLDKPEFILGLADSYVRITDFSKPVDPSKNSIDISTDKITMAIRLPDDVPRLERGILFVSDGVMHMLPGAHVYWQIADIYGNILNETAYRPKLANRVWHCDLKTQQWNVSDSGVDRARGAAVAFDVEKQVGWYYGGYDAPDNFKNGTDSQTNAEDPPYASELVRSLPNLCRLDRGKRAPVKVETDSSMVEDVTDGELVYIGGVGEAGILVLIGGYMEMSDPAVERSMQVVHIFDIAKNAWFAQSTTAQVRFPTDRSDFCSVIASAEDSSSYNIYIYGGSGYAASDDSAFEIFILTLPAFHWVKVYPLSGNTTEALFHQVVGHRCQKIHEKYMVASSGSYSHGERCGGGDPKSMRFQGMSIFDMSSLTWTTRVELENPKYLVPQVLYDIIGGNSMGNATTTQPQQGFDPKVAQIFLKKTTPVDTPTSANTTAATMLPTNGHSQERLPVGAISGGVIGGFVLVLCITALFLLWRRRRMASPLQLPPELASTPFNPQEIQDNPLYELHDPGVVFELPPVPMDPTSSDPQKEVA